MNEQDLGTSIDAALEDIRRARANMGLEHVDTDTETGQKSPTEKLDFAIKKAHQALDTEEPSRQLSAEPTRSSAIGESKPAEPVGREREAADKEVEGELTIDEKYKALQGAGYRYNINKNRDKIVGELYAALENGEITAEDLAELGPGIQTINKLKELGRYESQPTENSGEVKRGPDWKWEAERLKNEVKERHGEEVDLLAKFYERQLEQKDKEIEALRRQAEQKDRELAQKDKEIEALHRQAEALEQRNQILWQTLQATITIAKNQGVVFEDSYLQEIEKLRKEMERKAPEPSPVAPTESETHESQEEDREPVRIAPSAEQEKPVEEADGELREREAENSSYEERDEETEEEQTPTEKLGNKVKRVSLFRRAAGLPVRIIRRAMRAIPFIGGKKLENMTERQLLETTLREVRGANRRSTLAIAAGAAIGSAVLYYHNPEFAAQVNQIAREIQPYWVGATAAAQEALRIGGQTIADIRAAIESGWESISNITLPSVDVNVDITVRTGKTLARAIHSPELQSAVEQVQTTFRNFIIEGQRLIPDFASVKNFLSENGFDLLNSTLLLYIAAKVRGLRKKGEVSLEQQKIAVKEAVQDTIEDVLKLKEEEVGEIATAQTTAQTS